jgi:hypothetical protein
MPVCVHHILATGLPGGAQVQVGLGEQAHHLLPVRQHPVLQRGVLYV